MAQSSQLGPTLNGHNPLQILKREKRPFFPSKSIFARSPKSQRRGQRMAHTLGVRPSMHATGVALRYVARN